MLGDVQDGIEYLQVRQADIASLSRQAVLDLLKLRSRNLHHTSEMDHRMSGSIFSRHFSASVVTSQAFSGFS
ncbi:hypothetical protein [Variovorax ginsengisoli]|uniref:Uncharacterized protein n=1 Tax=Variovorax ginsengisoli TaxID=363844 RepID=A0ABT9S4S1_9BURK|nr:hypothetical protein [Variovorax ginsengisoli]MDP9899354.1 hypothetical protein [Variovorax ginsengisoli]